MRKFFIVLAVLAIAATSCKKDENEAMAEKTTKDPIAAKLLDFKQTIQSQNKEVVLYNLEEAEWNLEGLLNFEEANNEHNWYGLEFESRTYEVPVSNGQISSSDLNHAYENFLSEISIILADDENLVSDIVDIEITENLLKDEIATMNMIFSFGSTVNLYNYVQFGLTEYWVWCENGGPCGSNPSTEITGGTDLLQYKFNHPLSTGQSGYYTNVNNTSAYPMDFPSNPNNPAYPDREYIMYQGYSWSDCLSPAELNFYLNHFDYIKAYKVPADKDYISVVVQDEMFGGGIFYCHKYIFNFGDFHLGGGGGE